MCSTQRKFGPAQLPLLKWLLFSEALQHALLLGTEPSRCWLDADSMVLPKCSHGSLREANENVNVDSLLHENKFF